MEIDAERVQMFNDIDHLFILDEIATDYMHGRAGGSSARPAELGSLVAEGKSLIDGVTAHAPWVKNLIESNLAEVIEIGVNIVDQLTPTLVFSEKRAELREAIENGKFFRNLIANLDSAQSILDHTKAELDANLTKFVEAGAAPGDVFSRGACLCAGMALAVAVETQQYGAALGLAVPIAANCPA